MSALPVQLPSLVVSGPGFLHVHQALHCKLPLTSAGCWLLLWLGGGLWQGATSLPSLGGCWRGTKTLRHQPNTTLSLWCNSPHLVCLEPSRFPDLGGAIWLGLPVMKILEFRLLMWFPSEINLYSHRDKLTAAKGEMVIFKYGLIIQTKGSIVSHKFTCLEVLSFLGNTKLHTAIFCCYQT